MNILQQKFAISATESCRRKRNESFFTAVVTSAILLDSDHDIDSEELWSRLVWIKSSASPNQIFSDATAETEYWY